MSSPLLSAYRSKQSKLVAQACALQTVIAVFLAITYYKIQQVYLEGFHELGIISTLVSIPTIAGFFIWRMRRYEVEGWKADLPEWDLTGYWDYTVDYSITFLSRVTSEQKQLIKTAFSQQESGSMMVRQSIWELVISEAQGKIVDNATTINQSWHALSSTYNTAKNGLTHVFYNTSFFPPNLGISSKIEGVEHMRITKRDSQNKPAAMMSTFSSCAQCEGIDVQFIVTARAMYVRKL